MVAIMSCSFYGFDNPHIWDEQPADIFRYTEANFPVRKTITPHIQSKIPKMFGWQLQPGYEKYIYVDASYQLLKGATDYLITELGDNDIVVFPHPYQRNSIREEYQWLKDNLHKRYVRIRYQDELLEEQYKVITDDITYKDDFLLHAAIFAYRNNEVTRNMLKEWWYHVSRFHLNDQLSLPYVIKKSGCKYKVLDKLIPEVPYWKYIRHAKGN